MDQEADLLRAICANPDDDTPRLAYADWLDEHATGAAAHGRDAREMRDRARFIRVQIGLEQGTDPDRGGAQLDEERRVSMEAEANELLGAHREEWDHPLQALGARITAYRRGFPEGISIGAEQLLANADRFFTAAPLRGARIQDLDASGVEALAECPYLANLLQLDLHDNYIGDAGVQALATSPHLGRLQHLDLTGNNIGVAGTSALAGATGFASLSHLDLHGNDIGNNGAHALAHSPHLTKLTHLYLSDNAIGPDGATALAGTPHLRNLTRLDLSANYIGDPGAQALANSPYFTNMTALDLGINNIMAEGARALAESSNLRNLTHLYLGGNYIGDAGAEALANSPHLRNLTEIDIEYNGTGTQGARALADSPHLRPEAKASALGSAGFSHLAQQVQSPQTGHQPDGPG